MTEIILLLIQHIIPIFDKKSQNNLIYQNHLKLVSFNELDNPLKKKKKKKES